MFVKDRGSSKGYNDAFIEDEGDEVMGVFEGDDAFGENEGDDARGGDADDDARDQEQGRANARRMLDERVKVDEGLLSYRCMVVIPLKFIHEIYPILFLGKMVVFMSPLKNAHPTITN